VVAPIWCLEMARTTTIAAVVFILALAAVAVAAIYFMFRQPPFSEEFAICYQALPQDRQTGISGKFDQKGEIVIDITGKVNQPGTPTEAQLDTFLECVKGLTNRPIVLGNFVRLPLEPVGQVANRWSRETGGPKLLIDPAAVNTLSLIRIGPATGTKADLVTRWCAANAACVKCDPGTAADDTVQVLVSQLPNAPLVEKELPSDSGDPWPVPPLDAAGKPIAEPWQKIDQQGRRYYLECRPG
jgi:hypothetical protein